jgi:hypothetical protein
MRAPVPHPLLMEHANHPGDSGTPAVPEATLNASLLQDHAQARQRWAEGLAVFQAQMAPLPVITLESVVRAAKPAFALGFSYTAQKQLSDEGDVLRVTLRHRDGGEEHSEATAPEADSADWFGQTALLLAGLLGLAVGEYPQTIEPVPSDSGSGPLPSRDHERARQAFAVVADAAAAPAEEPSQPLDEWELPSPDPGEANAASGDSGLEPLSAAEIGLLIRMIEAMPPEARNRFKVEFRRVFRIPKTVPRIKDRINQRRHKNFIDAFERSLGRGAA